MAEDIRDDDSANDDLKKLRDNLIAECRVEEQNCLYTSTTFYIWLRILRFSRGLLWVMATLSGVIAASHIVKNDPDYRFMAAGAALAAVLLPALIRSMRLDNSIRAYTVSAAKFKVLQAEFRRAADVWSAKTAQSFEQEMRKLLRAMDKARGASLTPPEFCFRMAQCKIKKGDYADNGRGFALGFDGPALEQAFGTSATGHSTLPITYSDAALHKIQSALLETAVQYVSWPHGKGMSGEDIAEYMEELAKVLALGIVHSSVFFKHEAYANEQEYRYFQVHSAGKPIPEIKYRNRHNTLVPYRSFNWRAVAPGSLKSIVTGPAAENNQAFKFASDCLRDLPPLKWSSLKYDFDQEDMRSSSLRVSRHGPERRRMNLGAGTLGVVMELGPQVWRNQADGPQVRSFVPYGTPLVMPSPYFELPCAMMGIAGV